MEFPCGACICDVIVAEIYPPDITVIHNNGICKVQGFHCIQSRIYSCGADTDILYLPLFLLCHAFIKGVA